MRLALAFAALAATTLPACVREPGRKTLAAPAPTFDPASFFAGRTEATGTLHRVLKRPKQVVVHSTGRVAEDQLLVTQRILVAGEAPELKSWSMRQTRPGRWIGRLTGSTKPVIMQVRGNTLAIRYKLDSGLTVRQWLYMRPDGTVESRSVTTKLGTDFARMELTIRRPA